MCEAFSSVGLVIKVPNEAHILAQSGVQLSRFSHAAWHDGSASIWRVRAVVILEMVRLERVIAASGSMKHA